MQCGCAGGDAGEALEVFTTRPDTVCGATYMVVAPEHPLLACLTTREQQAAVEAYVQAAGSKSDLERTELQKSKTGVFTGDQSCALMSSVGRPDLLWEAPVAAVLPVQVVLRPRFIQAHGSRERCVCSFSFMPAALNLYNLCVC